MKTAALNQAAQSILAVYRAQAAKGVPHDAAQEFALNETCAMLGLDRTVLVAALEAFAA